MIDLVKAKRHKGSLDFPCDCCDKVSYGTVLFSRGKRIILSVCDGCWKKASGNTGDEK